MPVFDADTIVAPATPPGEGALGIIRLSGPEALTLAEKFFKGHKLSAQPTHTLHFGHIKDGEKIIDEVVAGIYRAPHSYTGEDVVEISCHGSPYILQQLLRLFTTAGARMALPGEFTERAFLNGKMDLAQAEAVADVIASQSEASHRAAMHTLRGGFSADLKKLREQLIEFSALIELELDFSQEDVEFADRTKLYTLIEHAIQSVQQLIGSFQLGNVVKNGVSVAIIGAPNAGKSTLLNVLLNEERALVSEIAGTTRDTVEEMLNINGILFRLIDTAGIREHTTDMVEQMGVGRSLEKMRQADEVIYLFDAREDIAVIRQQCDKMRTERLNFIPVANKTDLLDEATLSEKFRDMPGLLFISAKIKEGIRKLKQALYQKVLSDKSNASDTLVTNARHHAALLEINKSLLDIKDAMDRQVPGDLMALDIRRCLFYLGTITGEIQIDRDILGTIFGKFCIGK